MESEYIYILKYSMHMLLTICGMDNESAAIVLPIATSILIFIGGGLSKIFSDNVKRRKNVKSSRDIVFRWSEMTIDATNKQIISLSDLAKGISESTELIPEAFSFSRNMADKLRDVSAERMTSLFVTNSRPKCGKEDMREKRAYNIVSSYDFLTAIQDDIRDKYEIYNKSCHSVIERWNAVMIKSQHDRENLNSFALESKASSNNVNVSRTLNCLFNSYFDGRDRSHDGFKERYEKFIKPLNDAVDKCKSDFPDATCGKAIYEDAREMLMIFEQWKENIKGYSAMFAKIADNIQQSANSLAESIDYFEKQTKVRCWCR